MAALGIDEHRIHREGIDLPLPPGAHVLGATDAIERILGLEHHAFDAQGAGGLALAGEILPVAPVQQRRGSQQRAGATGHHPLQLGAALALRLAAQVVALPFQQVVGEQDDRHVFEDLLTQGLAADALLQQGEGLHAEGDGRGRIAAVLLLAHLFAAEQGVGRGVFLPDHDLAVDHGAIGQRFREGMQFGKTIGDQVFAPRPDPQPTVALDQLGADAIPLPFHLPVLGRPQLRLELLHRQLQGVGEKEGIGLAAALGVLVRTFRGDQAGIALGGGTVGEIGIAHQALGDALGIQIRQGGQGPGHQQLGDTDTEFAGDQLDADHQTLPIQLAPQWRQALGQLLRRQAAQGQQVLLQPEGQALGIGGIGGGNQQGHGLRQVTHRLVALFEQPLGQAGEGHGQFAQLPGRHQPTGAAAGEEVHRPGGIRGRGAAEVVHQGRELGIAGGGGVETPVEFGEGLHAWASAATGVSSSSPYSVVKPWASSPWSRR